MSRPRKTVLTVVGLGALVAVLLVRSARRAG